MSIYNSLSSINLSVDTVKEILIKYIEEDTKRTVEDITFNLDNVWEGYGANERAVNKFTNITVTFK